MKTSYSFILALIILLASCKGSTSLAPSPTWVVSTLAGGTSGYEDGVGTDARFNEPSGVAVDSSGNVYVADKNNHRIRKITKEVDDAGDETWTVSTIATTVQFNEPHGVALDSSGNVYVADSNNHRVRKITPGGEVSTLAGSGTTGGYQDDEDDKVTTTARFNEPYGVALDSSGNVYVADQNNHRIRKITEEENDDGDKVWKVSTIAGGTFGYEDGTAAQFDRPSDVAVDSSSGDVYVADALNNRVRKITEKGGTWTVSTLAGSDRQGHLDGAAATAQFSWPSGVALDSSGNVYVADSNNHRIRKITKEVDDAGDETWTVSTIATTARFNEPHGVAVDSSGNVYVADSNNHRIRKIEYRVP